MHSAPAVHYPVARSVRAGLALAGAWSLAAAVCLWWWAANAVAPWHAAGALVGLVCGAAVAWAQWRNMPVGALRWDGQAWWWQAREDEKAVNVQIRWDLQSAMLLHLGGMPLRGRWACVEASSQPGRWDDLRRALHASASTAASDGDVASQP